MHKLATLPARPGVYCMRDEHDRVLYVGKAASLKSRVRSYFQSQRDLHPRTRVMVSKVADLDVIATDTEMEALILESNLIKKHRPLFNVKLRDDKRYPMLEVTVGETWPRLRLVRRATDRASRYFGPYTNSHALRKTMKVLQRVFKIRTCSLPLDRPIDRPCLEYHIQQCTAPCTRFVGEADYRQSVLAACQFLEGHTRALVVELHRQMTSASEALDFEKCIRLRNVIQALEQVTEPQKMVLGQESDEDVLAVAAREGAACVEILQVREGKLVEEGHFIYESVAAEAPARVLESFVTWYYGEGRFIPPTVLVSEALEDPGLLEAWLTELRGRRLDSEGMERPRAEQPAHLPADAVPASRRRGARRVQLKLPQRGARRELVELAARNAGLHLDEALKSATVHDRRVQAALTELQEALELPDLPWRIECFDISNLQGKHPVASMVVFEKAVPKKSDYRKFKVRGSDTPDDFRMMGEVLERRFAHRDDPRTFPALPDLLVVDGGKGQLGVAVQVLEQQGLANVPVAGLAKQEELIFLPRRSAPVRLDLNSPALLLLRRLRDESHRFAITFHRKLRGKSVSRSLLDQVPGIGKTRKRELLRHFGSLGALMDASLEEIGQVPGVGDGLAQTVYEHLHARI